VDFRFDWAATGEGFAGVSPSAVTREMKFTAESVVVFNGAPFTPGVTFNDFVLLRVDQLFDKFGDPIASPYGSGVSMQITLVAALKGIQQTATQYAITGFDFFNIYYDGPNGGFTNASFGGALGNFADTAPVETAAFVAGTGGNLTTAPDGALDLFAGLVDLVPNGDFEISPAGGPLSLDIVVAQTNSNNALCSSDSHGGGTQTCGASTGGILGLFGLSLVSAGGTVPDVLAFHTKNDGSIEKLVPEPATVALMGLGLLGMGYFGRRRRS
jgi:hypothetical protein